MNFIYFRHFISYFLPGMIIFILRIIFFNYSVIMFFQKAFLSFIMF